MTERAFTAAFVVLKVWQQEDNLGMQRGGKIGCAFLLFNRFLKENKVACEMGLYYVLHIGKLRNKNALQRLLHSLGESIHYVQLYSYIISIIIFFLLMESDLIPFKQFDIKYLLTCFVTVRAFKLQPHFLSQKSEIQNKTQFSHIWLCQIKFCSMLLSHSGDLQWHGL